MTTNTIAIKCTLDKYDSPKDVQAYMQQLNKGRTGFYANEGKPPLEPRITAVLLEVPMLYQGWECDEWAWVVERADGTRAFVATSHGYPYLAADVSELLEKRQTYENAIAAVDAALALVAGGAK